MVFILLALQSDDAASFAVDNGAFERGAAAVQDEDELVGHDVSPCSLWLFFWCGVV